MPIPNKYDIGDPVVLRAETTVDAAVVSVTAAFKVKRPGFDTLEDVNAVEQSQGIYEGIYTPAVSGRHFYRFIASGAYVGQEEFWFDVREKHA
jgi:hypothetical protein